MRILHLIHQYLPEKIGGTELYTRTLARMQAAKGHDVSIFTPAATQQNWPDPAQEEGINVYRLPLGERSPSAVFQNTFRSPAIQKKFSHLLEKIHPEIIHIQHLMGLPTNLINAITAAHISYIVTLHDYWYFCANAQLLTNYDNTICSGPDRYLNCARCALARARHANLFFLQPAVAPLMALRNHRLQHVLDQAAHLIAPTRFVQDTYARLGLDSEKMTVVPHGIQPPDELSRPKRRNSDSLRIVYIGGLAPQKGVHILVEAINNLAAENYRLDIYGDPAPFPEYVASLKATARHPNIYLNGRLPHEDLWDVLAQSDLLVVPSIWYETASLIIQEAFAAGVPVIASNIGALRERVREGIDGLHFPPGNAAALSTLLEELHLHPSKLAQLSNGIQPVFTIDQHYQAIQKMYQLVLAQSTAV